MEIRIDSRLRIDQMDKRPATHGQTNAVADIFGTRQ